MLLIVVETDYFVRLELRKIENRLLLSETAVLVIRMRDYELKRVICISELPVLERDKVMTVLERYVCIKYRATCIKKRSL